MNERKFQQQLQQELSQIHLTQAQKTKILNNVVCRPSSRPLRLSAAFVTIVLVSLLVITALAWILTPTIAEWFSQRNDQRISSVYLDSSILDSPLAEQSMGDVIITVWEAIADENTFVTNTQFQYTGEDDITLVAYSGLSHEITPQEGIIYVSAVSYYGSSGNEIYTAMQTDDQTLSILSEGWQADDSSDTVSIEITLVSAGETSEVTITAPVTSLQTLATYTLSEEIRFSETGFILQSVTMVRTELRVYFSYEVSGAEQPITSAIRNLTVQVFDQNGDLLPSKLSYGEPVPEVLVVQVMDEDTSEVVEQQELVLQEDHYAPAESMEKDEP